VPDLKLAPLLEATTLERMRPALVPFFPASVDAVEIESTRLQAPTCYWVIYSAAGRYVTFKSFFSQADFDRYRERIVEYYSEQIEQPYHPRGGVTFLPELNALLWSFPFDPAMPRLYMSLDGEYVAGILGQSTKAPLRIQVVSYNPEIGAVFAYHAPPHDAVIAYGKVAPEDSSGLQYIIMERLYRSPASQRGELRLAKPLAFRADSGLLLQAPVPGTTLSSDRNRKSFLLLARHAASALAAIHRVDAPFGPIRTLDDMLLRVKEGQEEMALTAPPLYDTLRLLIGQIESRATRRPAGPLVPSHGDYKWDQFLEHRGRFSLIDLELFCQAEAAFDLGYFCAYLPPTTPRDWRDSAAAEMLRGAFLDTYAERIGERIDMGRVALYEAVSLALRSFSYIWGHQPGWYDQAATLLELALERLVSPEPMKQPPMPG